MHSSIQILAGARYQGGNSEMPKSRTKKPLIQKDKKIETEERDSPSDSILSSAFTMLKSINQF